MGGSTHQIKKGRGIICDNLPITLKNPYQPQRRMQRLLDLKKQH